MENWLKLKIGHLLRVTVLSGRYVGQYRSRLEEQNEEKLWIAVPLLGTDEIPVPPGSEIEVSYVLVHHGGAGNYSFRVPVLAIQEIPVRCLVIPVPEKVVKTQLRHFVRVKCDLQVQLRLLPEQPSGGATGLPERTEVKAQNASFMARARDISGGGMLLCDVPKDLAEGTAIELRIALPKAALPETVVGRVVRVLEDEDGGKCYGIEFTAIREATREHIIRYVYQRQREMRKRGAI